MFLATKMDLHDLNILSRVEELDAKISQEEGDEEETMEPQIFAEHDFLSERFRKTLYYGQLPSSDRPSLPMTELCVEHFKGIGADALEEKLDSLDMVRAAEITKNTCASPTSLILALLYLDRLRNKNPEYLHTVSSTDLFLVSLMVASKFLNDDGEDDEVFNDEWAESGGMDKKDLNKLEVEFLSAINWSIFVSKEDFESVTERLEKSIASRQMSKRGGWTTYSDLIVLARTIQLRQMWDLISECMIKVTAVCATAYAAGVMTMLGTCYVLSKTPLGPAAVDQSIQTLSTPFSHHRHQEEVPFDQSATEHVTKTEPDAASILNLLQSSEPSEQWSFPTPELENRTAIDLHYLSRLYSRLKSRFNMDDADPALADDPFEECHFAISLPHHATTAHPLFGIS